MAGLRTLLGQKNGPAGFIDLGTSKIACLIAERKPVDRKADIGPSAWRISGVGHHRSRGIKSGVIVDIDEAEKAVRAAVAQAERMAGVTLQEAVISVTCGRQSSLVFSASVDVESGAVQASDLAKAIQGGRSYAERDGRALLHMNRIGCRLDGAEGADDPVGLAARKLTLDLHAVSADDAPIRNAILLIERCHLKTSAMICGPYASGVAVTTSEERQLGITVIDIGGGVTSIASFLGGSLINAAVIAAGGKHIDFDIARALQTPLVEAERIKALYGSMVLAHSDIDDVFTYTLAGEEDDAQFQTTKAQLAEVIRPRISQLLHIAGDILDGGTIPDDATSRIVLTGGTSQLEGLADYSAYILGRPVRLGRPEVIEGLPASIVGYPLTNVIGLLKAYEAGKADVAVYQQRRSLAGSYAGRVGAWLRSGF